jgi:tetratricopeptide (TPR) repeat protein
LQSLVRGIGSLINKPISAPDLPNDRADTGKRRLVLFLLAGVALILLLGYGAYRLIRTGPDTNQNQAAGGDANNQNRPAAKACDSVSRQRAAEMTGKGLMMIDPGGNYNAATLQFREAIIACPDYTDAYFWRGQSLAVLQQNDKALADFKKVVEMTTDAETRQQAQKFIADIESPRPTPTPVAGNTNSNTNTNANRSTTPSTNTNTSMNTNTGGSNINANSGASNINQGSTHPDIVHAQDEMFAGDKSKRINARTTVLMVKGHDAKAVGLIVEKALAHQDNKDGIISALILLENIDPDILKENRRVIEKLLGVAREQGPDTAKHVERVQHLMNR